MLTKAHRVYHWDRRSNSISSDRLEDGCRAVLARGIAVYRAKVGARLGAVRNAARRALGGLRPDRVEAVVDLLDAAATYEWPSRAHQAERRINVFEAAAANHPVLDAGARRHLLISTLRLPSGDDDEITAELYADYPEFHRLAVFPPTLTPEDLQAAYDLAQAQALLYDAVGIVVEAQADFKHIVQYARLSRLLHRIERGPGRVYRLRFDGPNSLLRRTHAYGVDFAKFLAALVQAEEWRLEASVALRGWGRPATFALSSEDALRSNVPPPRLFDSHLEEGFARKFGEARGGWRLRRETVLLEAGRSLLVPDFVFTHDDGTEVALEIVGYWTPEYLADKFGKLAMVRETNLIIAVRRAWALSQPVLPPWALPFRTTILVKDLLPRLDAFRTQR
jgi:predicted nuclease of restriction endonuclease-like RecB superfamily